MSPKLKFEILENLGIISQDKDIAMELNLVRWSGSEPKFDLRRWKNEEDEKIPFKGLALDAAELAALKEILDSLKV